MTQNRSDTRNMSRLKDEQQVRQRAGIIFGNNDEYGAARGVEEVIANSVDEAHEGYGNLITIKMEDDGVVDIEDSGRGLPMGWNEAEQMYNWELALCTLYASGKYDAAQYGESTGLNGLGLTATQFASEFMDVWSTYDGHTYYMHFEKGRPVGELKITEPIREGTGTRIRYKPDEEVFPALKVRSLPADYFVNILRQQAMLNDGLALEFEHHELDKQITIKYNGGIVEFIEKIAQKSLLPKPVYYEQEVIGTDDKELYPENYKLKMKLAFTFSRETNFLEVYQNGSLLFELGNNKAVEGVRNAFTSAITEYARMNSKLAKSDKFLFRDIESLLVCIVSGNAPGSRIWFRNQTKGAINNPFVISSMQQFAFNSVFSWLNNNKAVADKVVSEALANKQAREESDKVSKQLIRKLSTSITFGNKPKEFVDCKEKDKFKRELYLVEGRSAKGSVLDAREDFQALFPLRGKPINCLKEKLTRVLMNDIISDTFRLLGCGMEVKSEYIDNLPEFDILKLNYDKIVICTDADVDGNHIRTLLIAMFYVLAPTLLKSGKVYIAETPLYEIEWKDEHRFAFDENEKKLITEELKALGASDGKITYKRSKGLGENDAEMMNISTMNPLTRRLTRIDYPEDDSKVGIYFRALLGDDIETRKWLIEEYFDITEVNN